MASRSKPIKRLAGCTELKKPPPGVVPYGPQVNHLRGHKWPSRLKLFFSASKASTGEIITKG